MPQYPAPASLSMLYILIRKFIDAATKINFTAAEGSKAEDWACLNCIVVKVNVLLQVYFWVKGGGR